MVVFFCLLTFLGIVVETGDDTGQIQFYITGIGALFQRAADGRDAVRMFISGQLKIADD